MSGPAKGERVTPPWMHKFEKVTIDGQADTAR
jgi:hypothetical protein